MNVPSRRLESTLLPARPGRDRCYSGSVVTKGGLVFVGRSDGRLTALDKDNGDLLWEFMTDAGVNSTVTTFERGGKQFLLVHAGGGEGGGSPLTSALTREVVLATMTEGRNTMPAFGELYTIQQMRDIAAIVVERLAVGRD